MGLHMTKVLVVLLTGMAVGWLSPLTGSWLVGWLVGMAVGWLALTPLVLTVPHCTGVAWLGGRRLAVVCEEIANVVEVDTSSQGSGWAWQVGG